MDQDSLHSEGVGHGTCMLSARPAETGERVTGHVMAARDRNLADRRRHIVDSDVEEAAGDLLEAFVCDRLRDLLQPLCRSIAIELLNGVGPEDCRELSR